MHKSWHKEICNLNAKNVKIWKERKSKKIISGKFFIVQGTKIQINKLKSCFREQEMLNVKTQRKNKISIALKRKVDNAYVYK